MDSLPPFFLVVIGSRFYGPNLLLVFGFEGRIETRVWLIEIKPGCSSNRVRSFLEWKSGLNGYVWSPP